MDSATVYVGIDVAKEQLVIAVRPTDECWETATDTKSLSALVRRLQALYPTGIIVEATGGYEQPFARRLVEVGLPVSVINPRHAFHFAQSSPNLAKTDVLDARVLAHYGQTFRPAPGGVRTGTARELHELVARRRQLVKTQTQESNRLAHDHTPFVTKNIRTSLKRLARDIASIDREIARLQDQEPLRERVRILRAVPGIGATSATTLITALPELGGTRPQADQRPRRGGAVRTGQWTVAWATDRARRACGPARDALYGDHGRHPLQPRHQGLLSWPRRAREAEEGGADRQHA